MTWMRYNGLIKTKRRKKAALKEILSAIEAENFFIDCGDFLLVDGIFPDVTKELKAALEKAHTKRIPLRGKISIGPTEIREIALETIDLKCSPPSSKV